MNKNFWTIVFLVVIIVAGVVSFLYWIISPKGLFERQDNEETVFPEGTTGTNGAQLQPIPTIGPEERQKLKLIASGDIVSFWPSATTTVQYFKQGSGFWQADYGQSPIKEVGVNLNINFGQVLGVKLSPSGDKGLIEYVPSGSNKSSFSVLDLATRQAKNLNEKIKATDWSPNGQSIVFYYSDSLFAYKEGAVDKQYLGTFDKDLLKERVLFNFHLSEDSILTWATTSKIYISQKPSGLVDQTVLAFDIKKQAFTPFVSDNGVIVKWDKVGNYGLLFSAKGSGGSPVLKLINKDGISLATFPKATLPEKCVFSKNGPFLYCAIAENIPDNVIWPDDYYQGAFNNRENIYKINLQSMEAEPVLSNAAFEIKGIDLSPDGANLLFYDSRSSALYALELDK